MKITICGSIAFIDEMEEVLKQLKHLGHDAQMPPSKFSGWDGKEWLAKDYYKFKKSRPFNDPEFLNNHTGRIGDHLKKVEWAEAVLVANYDKNGIANYIGPNTLMEMGVAFYLGKKTFLLNPVPETAWQEEILGMQPMVINGDLTLLK